MRKRDIPIVLRNLRNAVALAGLLTLCIPGCASKIVGGSIKHSTSEGEELTDIRGGEARMAAADLRVEIEPSGRVVIEAQRASIATTQPSIRTATTRPSESTETTGPSASGHGAMPKVGAVTEGQLGAVSFDEMTQALRNKANWPLFAIFAVGALICWKLLGSIPGAVLCAGMALLSVVWPALLPWLALACIAAVLLGLYQKNRERIRELVRGGDNVIEAFGAQAKKEMERAHSTDTKDLVRKVKGKR